MKAWKIVPLLVLLAVILFISTSPNNEKSEASLSKIDTPAEYVSMENPVLVDEASIMEGDRLYGVYCDTCHGKSGSSREKVTKDFDVQPLPLTNPERYTDGELFYITSKGVEGSNMMAYEMFLTEEERWHIVNYVKVLPTKRTKWDKIRDYFS